MNHQRSRTPLKCEEPLSFVVLVLLAAAAVALAAMAAGVAPGSSGDGDSAAASGQRCSVGEDLVPSCGALWGAYTSLQPAAGGDWVRTYTDLEGKVGRPFDIVKRYHDFSNRGGNGAFPDEAEQALARDGRTLFFAWVSQDYTTGVTATWRDIAAGLYDESVIDPVAARVAAHEAPVLLDFDHEMDGRERSAAGSMAEYARAFRHIRSRFDAAGASNVAFVFTVTGSLANTARVQEAYPGDEVVDWIGYDPYNFAACRRQPFESFDATIGPFYDWLQSAGHDDKPLMLAEYGSAPDPMHALGRAGWFGGVLASLQARPALKAVVYFNGDGVCPGAVSSSISQDPAALKAFGASGADPYFQVKR